MLKSDGIIRIITEFIQRISSENKTKVLFHLLKYVLI